MREIWARIGRFWTAEEVPRWIGMSLIGVLLFGLGAASYRGVVDTRERFAVRTRRANEDAIALLASSLAQIGRDNAAGLQHGLRDFTRWYRCESLRVTDATGIVLASMNLDEVGKKTSRGLQSARTLARTLARDASPDVPTQSGSIILPSEDAGTERQWVVSPIIWRGGGLGEAVHRLQTGATQDGATKQGKGRERARLQGVLLSQVDVSLANAHMGTALVVLAVVVLFYFVHRAMRWHFRSMSRIAESLLARGDPLEQDLHSLRLADEDGALATQWNRLIDLVEGLSATARRATASTELKEVLEKSRTGALAEVINAVPDGLLYVVERTQLALANTAARRVLEVDVPANGRASLDHLNPGTVGARVIEHLRAALGSDGAFVSASAVVEAEAGSGSYRVRVLPFHARRKTGECLVTITDISQQVRADKAAQEFIAQLTHELRTPLTNIRAYAETLSSGVFDDPKVISDCYNVITKETRRLSRLIEDILSMSQMEVGSIQLLVDDVDLRALLGDAVRDLRGLADEKQIDMQINLPSKLPVLRGDRDKLAVVMNNLLGNALKYTPPGGSVHVGCQAQQVGGGSGEEVLVTVKDTGMGIDASDHGRIFEKFQRGSSEAVEDIVGTGLGLTTAREIARGHGGDIEVMSAEGQGATFIVHLPLGRPGHGGASPRGMNAATRVG